MSLLKEILIEKGWDFTYLNHLKPSEKQLAKMGISTITQWNKILNGETDLTVNQAKAISEWLEIPLERLFANPVAKMS